MQGRSPKSAPIPVASRPSAHSRVHIRFRHHRSVRNARHGALSETKSLSSPSIRKVKTMWHDQRRPPNASGRSQAIRALSQRCDVWVQRFSLRRRRNVDLEKPEARTRSSSRSPVGRYRVTGSPGSTSAALRLWLATRNSPKIARCRDMLARPSAEHHLYAARDGLETRRGIFPVRSSNTLRPTVMMAGTSPT